MLLLQNAVNSGKIEIELTGVFGLEVACFQFDHDIGTQVKILEQQVNIKIITAYIDVILITEKSKTRAKLQEQLCNVFH